MRGARRAYANRTRAPTSFAVALARMRKAYHEPRGDFNGRERARPIVSGGMRRTAGSARARAAGRALCCALAVWGAGANAAAHAAPRAAVPATQDARADREAEEAELLEALALELVDALQRADLPGAKARLAELTEAAPEGPATRLLGARYELERGQPRAALASVDALLGVPGVPAADERPWLAGELGGAGAEARRLALRALLELGDAAQLRGRLDAWAADLDPARDARDAWVLGIEQQLLGERERARALWRQAAAAPQHELDGAGLAGALARARALRALGELVQASNALVEADRAQRGRSAEVLVELASLYFEADGEVEQGQSDARSPGELYREALRLAPGHEGALLGLYALGRLNWRRSSRSPDSYLDELLSHRPDSIAGALAKLAGLIDDGELAGARASIAALEPRVPLRRELRTARAAMAWIEHRRDEAERLLAELARENANDARPERELGRHLVELYRFAEARPFLERAVARDGTDWLAWGVLGRALACAGELERAGEALARAESEARGRQDAWRNNTRTVLAKMERTYARASFGDLRFRWLPDEGPLHAIYQRELYERARVDLAERYGYTPGATSVEIFREHRDFSVRSTGFEGYPATGVCFGPVLTSVSPLSELRGRNSWARTAFHEYSHVIHLGLSHNRCPRWITEGLATWEEENHNPAWTRNMRRELLDARANGELIPVRKLNRAFRGSRVLFGYYQGGLLCQLLIGEHGFAPMVALLEAFDRGDDLDEALGGVFGLSPEQLDARFEAHVDELLAALRLEPRWNPSRVASLRLSLARRPPEGELERARWLDQCLTAAFGLHQQGKLVDAEELARRAQPIGASSARYLRLRAELELARGNAASARARWEESLALGEEDFRARMGLGVLLRDEDPERALAHFQAAEHAFPGFDDEQHSAELAQAELHASAGRELEALEATERWLRWNSEDKPRLMAVARAHAAAGRHERALRGFELANEVDPFERALHLEWADSLHALGRWREERRELQAALLVPGELELEPRASLSAAEQAELWARRGECAHRLGELGEARADLAQALALDASNAAARELERALAQAPADSSSAPASAPSGEAERPAPGER